MQTVRSAGCVVLRSAETSKDARARAARPTDQLAPSVPTVLLVWTLDYPDPTLPKGKLNPGERSEDAARREVREETGYPVSIVDPAPVTVETILAAHPPTLRKIIDFYLARPDTDGPVGPVGPPITRAEWVPVNQAVQMMLRPEEVDALRKCMAKSSFKGLLPFPPP